MARYDLECLLNDVKSVLQANLNTQIAAINTEKGDSITLASIDNDAYFLQQLNGKSANWNPILVYGVDTIESSSHGPLGAARVTLSVAIMVHDSGEDLEIGNRMFRYLRALEEVFQRNWRGGQGGVSFEVRSLVPIPLTDVNTSQLYRAVGVELEGSLPA